MLVGGVGGGRKCRTREQDLTVNAIRVRLVAFGLDDSRFSPVQASQDWRGSRLAGSKSGPPNDWLAVCLYKTRPHAPAGFFNQTLSWAEVIE